MFLVDLKVFGRAVFAYLHIRMSGVQAVLIFMHVGERSSSAPPLHQCRLSGFAICPSTQDRDSSLDSSSPETCQHNVFLKLNVFLWALEFHYSRHSCGCGFVAMVLPAYVTNSLFLFHGSVAASGLYFLMLGEHVSDVLATRRRCVAGRDPFILSYGCSPMTLKPWRHGHVQ